MLSGSLADAYAAAQGTVEVTTLHIFGLPVELVGFQGGIIVALLIGVVTAKLDIFFEKKVPEVVRLLVSPLLTTLSSAFLLFMIIGPVGRGLASGITEPALFGVNLRYRYPIIGGCIGGAICEEIGAFAKGSYMGIDTVQLGGKYFTLHVTQGQALKKGDCLMEVDFEKIAGLGYDTTICMIFAELAGNCHVEREEEKQVAAGDRIAVITE